MSDPAHSRGRFNRHNRLGGSKEPHPLADRKSLRKRLKATFKLARSHSCRRKHFMDDFLKWLADRGLQVGNRLRPHYTEATGWGIYAVDTIRPDETVLKVPDSLLIRASTVTSRSPYGEAIKKHSGLLNPFDALVLFFCFEDEATSDYGPYLRMLPRTFSTPAVVCPDLAVEALPMSAQPLLLRQREELVQIYEKMKIVSKEWTDEQLSRERFLWAWHVVNTRCIYVENKPDPAIDNSSGDTIVIVPFVDLLNHAPDAQIAPVYVTKTKTYDLQANGTIRQESEAFVCYGPHSNARLLFEYGFVLPENANTYFSLSTDDIISLCRRAGLTITTDHENALQEANLGCRLYATQLKPSWNVMAAFRIATMHPSELARWKNIIYSTSQFRDPKLLEQTKTLLNLLLQDLETSRQKALTIALPESLAPIIDQLWREELAIVRKCIDHDLNLSDDDSDE